MTNKPNKFCMNKRIILVIGILSLLVIAGCEGSGIFGGGSDKKSITDIDIRKGFSGLKMEFLTNAPPENVFEDGRFPISLKIKNAGASDIVDGVLVFGLEKAYVDYNETPEYIVGYESIPDGIEEVMPIYREGVQFDINGKSIFSPVGDEDFITVNAQAKQVGPQSETHPSTIFATVCYPYKTIFGTSVCVDTDIIGERRGQKACSVRDLLFSDGQGAPVAIAKVETRMLPQEGGKVKAHFIIRIENVGNGQVVDVSSFNNACTSQELDYKDFFNKIVVSASLSGKALECNGEEINETHTVVKLRGGKGSTLEKKGDLIRCSTKDADDIDTGLDAYVAPFSIELDYGYTFSISKDIIIEKILTY